MGNLLVGGLYGVTAVANVASNFEAEVTADRTHSTLAWHSRTKHLASLSRSILSFPNHSDNRSRSHVRNETREEFLGFEIFVVGLHVLLARHCQLHCNELVSLLLETLDDFTNDSTLDAIGLDL